MKKSVDIDEPVVQELERLRRKLGDTFDSVLNAMLRSVLGVTPEPQQTLRRDRFETRTVDVGKCRFDNLDDVEGILSAVEGDLRQ